VAPIIPAGQDGLVIAVRMGCLGAARIAPSALVKPARHAPEVELLAVAARDRQRAETFARKHAIPVVADDYDAVLADPQIDAVYNPLPNGLHGLWTIRALEAGKHVLCEKPFTANAPEAERVAVAAERTGLVVMEAFHWRYHPLAARVLEIIASGELGTVRRVEAALCFPLFKRDDIRWRLDLAGGALMDAGCYAVHMVRTFAGAEPSVTSASARLRSPGVDRSMEAELAFADGRTGRITTSMWSSSILKTSAVVVGDEATVRVFNPTAPHAFHRLTVKGRKGTRHERVRGRHTYDYQLKAFAAAVLHGAPTLTPPSDSIANMRVIDDVYRAAGMEPRRGATD
jgi:predicted dehydrogenase